MQLSVDSIERMRAKNLPDHGEKAIFHLSVADHKKILHKKVHRSSNTLHVSLVCEQAEDLFSFLTLMLNKRPPKNVNSGRKMFLHSVFFSIPWSFGWTRSYLGQRKKQRV